MGYTKRQVQAAKENAALHGHRVAVSDETAIEFLDWFHSHATPRNSVEDAKRAGLMGLCTNGVRQQEVVWLEILGAK